MEDDELSETDNAPVESTKIGQPMQMSGDEFENTQRSESEMQSQRAQPPSDNIELDSPQERLHDLLTIGLSKRCKVGCVFPMDVVSLLPHEEFGRNDHREGPPHFIPNYL